MENERPITLLVSSAKGSVHGLTVPAARWHVVQKQGLLLPAEVVTGRPTGPDAPCPDASTEPVLLRLLPDPETRAAWSPGGDGGGEQVVLCDVEHPHGQDWDGCARRFLKRALDRMQIEHGLEVACSYEHRLILSREAQGAWRDREALHRSFGTALERPLREAGIEMEYWGGAPDRGRMSIVVRSRPALNAVDGVVVFGQVVRSIAAAQGLTLGAPSAEGRDEAAIESLPRIDLLSVGDRMGLDRAGEIGPVLKGFLAGIESRPPQAGAGAPRCRVNPELGTGGPPERDFCLELLPGRAPESPYLLLGAAVAAGARGLHAAMPASGSV